MVIFIKNFQLHLLDVINKTTSIVDHKYSDKLFVMVGSRYVVDVDRSIYKVINLYGTLIA
jgi:hypothetical protein